MEITPRQVYQMIYRFPYIETSFAITDLHFYKWSIEQYMQREKNIQNKNVFHLWTKGYSTYEIARVLKVSENNIKQRKKRLVRRIVEHLNEE
jgi:DNA-binding NarL/FixJ family response regulator